MSALEWSMALVGGLVLALLGVAVVLEFVVDPLRETAARWRSSPEERKHIAREAWQGLRTAARWLAAFGGAIFCGFVVEQIRGIAFYAGFFGALAVFGLWSEHAHRRALSAWYFRQLPYPEAPDPEVHQHLVLPPRWPY